MFCKNCGNQIAENHTFCGNCGTKTFETSINSTGGSINNSHEFIKVKNTSMKFIKTYLSQPISFFKEVKNSEEDLNKVSLIVLTVLSVLHGFINIMYSSALINSSVSFIKKIPNLLAKSGVISPIEVSALTFDSDYLEFLEKYKSYYHNLIDNKDIFISGLIGLVAIVLVTAIVLQLLNIIILKNKLNFTKILFISTTSYIPLVLATLVGVIATMISMLFGVFIIMSGYILSFITLYNGILEFSEESKDKVFTMLTIAFVIISAVLSIAIIQYIESSLAGLMKSIDNFPRGYNGLF